MRRNSRIDSKSSLRLLLCVSAFHSVPRSDTFPDMKLIGRILILLGLAAIVGCEKDIREPGEPRIQMNVPR